MDIGNVGFEIANLGYLSRKKIEGLGKVYGFDIDGNLEIGDKKDPFTGSIYFLPQAQKVLNMSIITEKRIASFNVLKSLLNLRSLTAGDFSIEGKVRGGDINEIVAVIGSKDEVQLGNLSFAAFQENPTKGSTNGTDIKLDSPFFKNYLSFINLLVVHALVMQNTVADEEIIADLNDFIRDIENKH